MLYLITFIQWGGLPFWILCPTWRFCKSVFWGHFSRGIQMQHLIILLSRRVLGALCHSLSMSPQKRFQYTSLEVFKCYIWSRSSNAISDHLNLGGVKLVILYPCLLKKILFNHRKGDGKVIHLVESGTLLWRSANAVSDHHPCEISYWKETWIRF